MRKYQTEVMLLKNTIIKLKNTLKGFNSKLDKAEKKDQWSGIQGSGTHLNTAAKRKQFLKVKIA